MQITKDGVTVSVKADAGKCIYWVEVRIPKDVIKRKLVVNDRKNFKLEFEVKQPSAYDKEIVMNFKNKYEIDGSGKVDLNKCSTLTFENKRYKCTILLRPKFYIPAKIRKRNERIKQKERKYGTVSSITKPCESESKFTNYSYNNAKKPFVGGAVTPK